MTDKRIAKLLQGKCFNKELFLDDTNEALVIEQINSVAHLPLENIKLGEIATSIIIDIAAALENLGPHLKKLSLCHEQLDLRSSHIIANLIQNSKLIKLKIISFRSSVYSSPALFIVLNSIKQSSVRELKLCNIYITEHNVKTIADITKNSQIVELYLDECRFAGAGADAGADAGAGAGVDANATLSQMLNSISGSALQTLRLRRYLFIDEEIVALSACVKNSSLIKLCLIGKCGTVSRDVWVLLMESVQESNIAYLSLRCDDIRIAEINTCIASSHIKKLKLSYCFNVAADSIAIIDSIKRCKFIESLTICDMIIDQPCAEALCDLLENSSIKTIKLEWCHLQDEQLIALIPSIKRSSLKSLGLEDNHIGLNGALAICDLLENYDLIKLNLDMNLLSDSIINSMIPSIKKSTLIKLCVDTYRRVTSGRNQRVDKKIRHEIEEILQVQQQISYGRYKMKSANVRTEKISK